jgi:hypothetical protein
MLWEIFYNLSGYNTKYVHIYIYIYIYIVYTLLKCSRSSFSFLLPQRASLKRDSRPNLYVCMYIYIYIYIWQMKSRSFRRISAYHSALLSGRQAILMPYKQANRQCDHYTRCFYHYTRCFRNYTQWFEHYTWCFQHYFYIFFPCIWFHDCLNLVCDYSAFWLWSAWQWHALKRFIYKKVAALCEFYIII